MSELRTPEAQARGLQSLAAEVDGVITETPGDVVCVRLGAKEVVYAVGNYDGWYRDNRGELRLGPTNMSLDEARRWLQG